MAWLVGVEVHEDLTLGECEVEQEVPRGEGDLAAEVGSDDGGSCRRRLAFPLGPCDVRWRAAATTPWSERRFKAAAYRLFKLSGTGDYGRLVQTISRGHYLVVTPRSWQCSPTGTPAPIAPECVMPERTGVQAHHLLVHDDQDGAVFTDAGVEQVELRPISATGLRLVGHRIDDADEVAGPLFGREAPRLRSSQTPAEVVVGFEGPLPRRKGRYSGASFDHVRPWIERNQPAWYFVRLYDQDGVLMDSADFRYVKSLHALSLDAHRPVPSRKGHAEVQLHVRLGPEPCFVSVEGRPMPPASQAGPSRELHITLPVDRSRVALEFRGHVPDHVVSASIAVPRVWWSIATESADAPPTSWQDRPCGLTAEQFRPTSTECLAVRLPWAGWADRIRIGWRGRAPRERVVARAEEIAWLPLRDLGDELDLLPAEMPAVLELSLRADGARQGPVQVASVPARAPVPVQKARTFRLGALSAPRLMSVLARVARCGGRERSAVRHLRRSSYRRSRRGGAPETEEFVRDGLALLAAVIAGEQLPGLSGRWAHRAAAFGEVHAMGVAVWRRRLRVASVAATPPSRDRLGRHEGRS